MSSDFVAALLIGLIGSSHCLVMCGGIAGALQLSMSGSDVHKFGLQLCLSAGRLTTYALFGAAVGYFGVSAMQLAGAVVDVDEVHADAGVAHCCTSTVRP